GEVLLLAPRLAGGAAIDAALEIEVTRRRLPPHRGTLGRVARALVAGRHLARLLGTGRFDYILCGQLLSLGGPIRRLARRHGIPYALFVHGADLLDYQGRFPWDRMIRRIVADSDAVIANSRFTAALVERHLPGAARRILVLPMGVEPAEAPDAARVEALRARYGLGDAPVLLTVARLVQVKGHDTVIEALARLGPRGPRPVYLVVGDGPCWPALRALARRLGMQERVRFAGAVPAADLPAHYDLATLFVQPSRDRGGRGGIEGFGLSFLEAAAHGLVSIGGRSGGVPEAIREGESGLLVRPDDPAALAGAIERLLADPEERRLMSGAARRWAAAHTWDRGARLLVSLAARGTSQSAA
ncbi:MAG: glycosyltransferase family 4 protein, partial [Candidatus Polarisedimenticolia bacterium]